MRPCQESYVAPNVRSLAECYLYRDNNDVFPFAIKVNETVVGFAMYYTDIEEKSATIWRIMIDENYQGQGYGTDAMVKLEKMIGDQERYKYIFTSYNKSNTAAEKLYESLGYLPVKVNEYDEVVVKKNCYKF